VDNRKIYIYIYIFIYRLSNRWLLAKLVPTFADRGCHVVSVMNPYGRILIYRLSDRCLLAKLVLTFAD
jgi:hypothetical protein